MTDEFRPVADRPNGKDCLRSQTFTDLALRELTPSQALKDGRATILAGSRSSFAELFRVLAYTPPRQFPLPPS